MTMTRPWWRSASRASPQPSERRVRSRGTERRLCHCGSRVSNTTSSRRAKMKTHLMPRSPLTSPAASCRYHTNHRIKIFPAYSSQPPHRPSCSAYKCVQDTLKPNLCCMNAITVDNNKPRDIYFYDSGETSCVNLRRNMHPTSFVKKYWHKPS